MFTKYNPIVDIIGQTVPIPTQISLKLQESMAYSAFSRNQLNKSHQISYTTDIFIILLMGISRAGKGWKGPSFDMG